MHWPGYRLVMDKTFSFVAKCSLSDAESAVLTFLQPCYFHSFHQRGKTGLENKHSNQGYEQQ